jgi:hypothetical protein
MRRTNALIGQAKLARLTGHRQCAIRVRMASHLARVSGRKILLAEYKFSAAPEIMLLCEEKPDESKAGRLVHCGLYCLVLDNSWKSASARAKVTSATL